MNLELLKSELLKIKDWARAEDYEAAWRLLEMLTLENPREYRIWTTRAYIHSRQDDDVTAISDLNRAIELCDKEPAPFITRGLLFFQNGSYEEAVDDFTKVIELCDYYQSDYYRESAHFYRADSYLRMGQFEKARAECRHVSDGMRTWTDKLRTKADILAECS